MRHAIESKTIYLEDVNMRVYDVGTKSIPYPYSFIHPHPHTHTYTYIHSNP